MGRAPLAAQGAWRPDRAGAVLSAGGVVEAARRFREPVHVVADRGTAQVGAVFGGTATPGGTDGLAWIATLPPMYPEWLGDRSFGEVHGTRFPYVAGAMANGIHTVEMAVALGRAGMLGFFGAAGLGLERTTQAVDRLQGELGDAAPWGVNLIHAPQEPDLERAVSDLLITRGVRRVEASAFMALSPSIVAYAYKGVREAGGRIVRPNAVIAKISRAEVALRFLMPPPAEMLDKLVQDGRLTADEARLARRLPVAEDLTCESDSGGHTDNRPLGALFPTIVALRDRVVREQGYDRPVRVGAAGGLGTPSSVAGAFGMGAAYVLTGSVNQACVESGLSAIGRGQLAAAGMADVTMAPAADMFELGVEVQVLKRGTLFAQRGHRLYEIYRSHKDLDALPAAVAAELPKLLGRSIDEVWAETESFWSRRDPREVERALREPHHRMALCFRWYLGLASRWAITGEPSRKLDYQIWCGPAMGAFNTWTEGTFLEKPEAREVVQVGLNLLEGACVVQRAAQLRAAGVPVPDAAFGYVPRPLTLA